jgi:hypothetical protein
MSDRERLELVAMFAPFALFSCKQVGAAAGIMGAGLRVYVALAVVVMAVWLALAVVGLGGWIACL